MRSRELSETTPEFPELMTAAETALYLGISLLDTLSLIRKGHLPSIRLGDTTYKVDRRVLERGLHAHNGQNIPGIQHILVLTRDAIIHDLLKQTGENQAPVKQEAKYVITDAFSILPPNFN